MSETEKDIEQQVLAEQKSIGQEILAEQKKIGQEILAERKRRGLEIIRESDQYYQALARLLRILEIEEMLRTVENLDEEMHQEEIRRLRRHSAVRSFEGEQARRDLENKDYNWPILILPCYFNGEVNGKFVAWCGYTMSGPGSLAQVTRAAEGIQATLPRPRTPGL